MAKRMTLEDFLNKAKELHPLYDFSLVKNYVNNSTKIPVICHKKDITGKEHGVFLISPANLLSGKGCCKCNGKGYSNDERKELCNIVHDGKYDYSKSDFSKVKEKTIVICNKHGEFITSFDEHFNKKVGCKFCSKSVRDLKSFVENANKIHDNEYSYEKTNYINSHTKVIITCPIHGDFLQMPNAHLRGQGCPLCNKKSVLEKKIEKILECNSIKFIKDKKEKWLITDNNGQSHLDFFLPDCNLAIECQGKQHFGKGGWSDKYNFEMQHKIDAWKKQQCELNSIELIYFANKNDAPDKYIGKIFTNEKELLNYIKYLLIK